MATQLFLRNLRDYPYKPSTMTSVDGSSSLYADEWSLNAARGAAVDFRVTNTVNGPTAGVDMGSTIQADRWCTAPLAADITISGTITVNLWAFESNMSANVAINLAVYRLRPDGTRTEIGRSSRTTELGTSAAVQNFTITPSSTGFVRGDRIEVAPYGDDSTANMGTGFTFTVDYNGGTPAADGDSYVTFTENLTFVSPAGSQLFLTSTAAGINPGSATELEMWTSRGASSTTSTTTITAGPTAGVQLTNTAGGTALEWYSKPLQAVTLEGGVYIKLRAWRSVVGPQPGFRVELAVVNGDGSGATVIADNQGVPGNSTYFISATSDGETADTLLGILPTSVTDGQRLRVRLYADDPASDAVAGGTLNISYNGPTPDAAGDSYLTLVQTLAEYSAVPVPRHGFVNFQDPGVF